jgi:hypothetical protein
MAGLVVHLARCRTCADRAQCPQELFDVEGAVASMVHPSAYMAPGEVVTGGELEDRSRKYGETVVGYVDSVLQATFCLYKQDKVAHEDVEKFIVVVRGASSIRD